MGFRVITQEIGLGSGGGGGGGLGEAGDVQLGGGGGVSARGRNCCNMRREASEAPQQLLRGMPRNGRSDVRTTTIRSGAELRARACVGLAHDDHFGCRLLPVFGYFDTEPHSATFAAVTTDGR